MFETRSNRLLLASSSRLVVLGLIAVGLALAGEAGQMGSEPEGLEPARLLHGRVPPVPPLASTGGEVVLELVVDEVGAVTEVIVLTDTPPFTSALASAARDWRFQPARDEEGPVSSRVLVAALYREPAFYSATTVGEPPSPVAQASPAVPYPTRLVAPPYPPHAFDSGDALLAVPVGPTGAVADVEIVSATPGFGDAAADAVRQWAFRPARVDGAAVPSIAYAVVAFRQPIVR